MATYTWDAIYDRLKVDQGGLPNKSTQDMLDTFWTLAGYPDGTLGADEKVAFYESQGAIGDSLGDLEYDYWYRIGPNILAAKGAVFAIDAAQSISGEQWALNRGSGGQVLRAKYGSVARAEIRNGVGLLLPGANGNYAEVPDSAALSVGGDIDVIVCAAVDRWATGSVQGLVCKVGSIPATANLSYALYLTAAGELQFQTTDGMATIDNRTSSVNLASTTPGSVLWMRALYNTVATRFYTSTDGVTWVQLGSSQPARTITIVDTAESVRFGQFGVVGSPLPLAGRIISAQVWAGNSTSSGSKALDVDFTAQPDLTSSFVASTGQTVTVTAANAVDTNDPLLLDWSGRSYVYCPGTVGNLISSGWPAPAHGSATYTVKWRPEALGGFQPIAGTDSTYGGFILNGTNRLGVYARDASTAFIGDSAGNSTPIPGIANGVDIWLRGRVTASSALCEYWYSYDATDIESEVNWISLGTFVGFNAGATISPRSTLHWGSYSSGLAGPPGRFYAGSFEADGVVHSAWRMINGAPTPYVGQPVTVNRSATGRKTAVVTRPIWLFGTDDYMEVADNDLLDFSGSDPLSAVVVFRRHGTPASNMRLVSKVSGTGYLVGAIGTVDSIAVNVNDGSFKGPAGVAYSGSSLAVGVLVRNITSGTITGYVNATTTSTTDGSPASLGNSGPLRVGAEGGSATSFLDGEVLAVGIFRRALTADEIAQIVTYYGAS